MEKRPPSVEGVISNAIALLQLALEEDIGSGDITSNALIPETLSGAARMLAKEPMVVCGQPVVRQIVQMVHPALEYIPLVSDGDWVGAGESLGEVRGPMRAILSGERVALNFLQRLSGVATQTAHVIKLIEGTGVKVLDTRKTTPGLRVLEKYAVVMGGGHNHRIGLFDAVLIKNNHIDAIGGDVAEAIRRARMAAPAGCKIEVEVRNEDELSQALSEPLDAILLDNMSPEQVRRCVEIIRSHEASHSPHGKENSSKEMPSKERDGIEIEVSGGITDKNIRAYATTGISSISLGMLTHSVRAVDISLRFFES